MGEVSENFAERVIAAGAGMRSATDTKQGY